MRRARDAGTNGTGLRPAVTPPGGRPGRPRPPAAARWFPPSLLATAVLISLRADDRVAWPWYALWLPAALAFGAGLAGAVGAAVRDAREARRP